MMKIVPKLFTVMIILILFPSCLTLEGKITVKGSEPHTYLVLVTEDQTDYKIAGKFHDEILKNYQQKILKVKGKIVRDAMGPGFPAELEVLKIISIKDSF